MSEEEGKEIDQSWIALDKVTNSKNNRNEIIGILSFHVINFLQFGQNDLPDTTPLFIGSL